MCTLSIFTRIVRWKVKDFASCFLACRFPVEEEPGCNHLKETIVFERKDDDSRGKEIDKRLSWRTRSSTLSKNTVSVDNDGEKSSRPCFSDEDYIVFCFKEDGAFIVMEDGNKSQESNTSSCSCPVNTKLDSAEDAKRDKQSEAGNEAEISAAKVQGDGERSNICWEVEETPNHRGTVSVESSGSNQSDGSTGSFAFPVLGWEWMGSPVQMPKSGLINTRKNKADSVHFQCLRF
ncbi:BREAKING OF ASYMMETRY IN THE STOMATAL LINEAGE [Hibiscus trionum]|uniref:BREAKING OF ASYMMETRY IN THE STOMATAL LINEAGE n=1 Tax=Hibiscus trionum TaxID=183268 RepID=A0A9W7LQE0_HIBTR|nr:BREAKING OF ASYMMETRY IN THE STOMATAL LINEAGE [Hibiscus trionum]